MAGITYQYNRTKQCFKLNKINRREVQPPETYEDTHECCSPMLVLAHTTDTTSWKNDTTSAWYKLDDLDNNVEFKLYKQGDTLANYQPTLKTLEKDSYGFYITIPWKTVLSTDGIGCYYIQVNTILDGVSDSFLWGEYNLQEYTTENAQNTIRVKVDINQYNSIEDLDFTDTHLIDTLRIGGFFGNMIPNFKIDNLIYENRRFENIQRERIATYTLTTDPILFKYSDLLVNFYLLAENTIWISDHNEFNNSLFYKDKELIVNNSPEVDYKEFSNLVTVKCEFTDKVRNNLAKYNG